MFILRLHLLGRTLEQAEAKADKVFTPELILKDKRSIHERKVLKYYKNHGLNIAKQAHAFKCTPEEAAMDLMMLMDCKLIEPIKELHTL
jgi:hypothetical protein